MGQVYGKYETIPGLVATSSLASSQYYVVKFSSTAGEIKVSSAATDSHAGIVQNDPAAGGEADVAFSGICYGSAGGAITVGAWVTSNSTGQLAATTTANHNVVGKALEAASALNDIIMVGLCHNNY